MSVSDTLPWCNVTMAETLGPQGLRSVKSPKTLHSLIYSPISFTPVVYTYLNSITPDPVYPQIGARTAPAPRRPLSLPPAAEPTQTASPSTSSPPPLPPSFTASTASTTSTAATAPDTTSTTTSYRPVRKYRNLRGDDFRHPLDLQNTTLLRALPGLELVAKNLMGPVAEQVLLLENIGTAVKIGPAQLPSIHALLEEACDMLDMDMPELYIRQNPVPNAYTLAITGRAPFIVVHTSLVELLTPAELQSVLAHELGHLKCEHGIWLTLANIVGAGTATVLPMVSDAIEENLMRWLRAAELTCDRAALLVAQDEKVVISALMKLAGGSPVLAAEMNVDEFLKQARSYDEASATPVGWYLRNAQTRSLTHPLPVLRAREVDRWGDAPGYRTLLEMHRETSSRSSGGE